MKKNSFQKNCERMYISAIITKEVVKNIQPEKEKEEPTVADFTIELIKIIEKYKINRETLKIITERLFE